MKILALEFSTDQRGIAVLASDSPEKPAAILAQRVEVGVRQLNTFAAIADTLRQAGLDRAEVDTLAVGLGPGSYTGIRVAISIAQGWQLARNVRLCGVSSAEALAHQAQAENLHGKVHVVIDAQRNEFYLAAYQISPDQVTVLEPLRLASFAEVETHHRAGELLAGPEVRQWFDTGRTLFPSAVALGRLAARFQKFVPGDTLEPIYLRQTTFIKAPPPRTDLLSHEG